MLCGQRESRPLLSFFSLLARKVSTLQQTSFLTGRCSSQLNLLILGRRAWAVGHLMCCLASGWAWPASRTNATVASPRAEGEKPQCHAAESGLSSAHQKLKDKISSRKEQCLFCLFSSLQVYAKCSYLTFMGQVDSFCSLRFFP